MFERKIIVRNKLLILLKKDEDYISGEVLSGRLGVSRAAIWKNMKKLKDEGYIIHSRTNKGYKLIGVPDIINEQEIKDGLKTKYIGQKLYAYDVTCSTNAQAKKEAGSGAIHGSLFVAEMQTDGKGRFNKEWLSPENVGIWLSILLRPDVMPSKIMQISLISGIVVCKAIRNITGLNAQIKWPNDIIINSKKVCGILTEMVTEEQRINYVVNGIGINVNTREFQEDIKNIATSLYIETGKIHSRKLLIQQILTIFEEYYEKLIYNDDLKSIIDEYTEMCLNIGKDVVVMIKGEKVQGVAVGITEIGELIIKTENGMMINFCSGEVSVRGINGYI